jgi:ElaA protein
MKIEIKHFNDLSIRELYDMISLRVAVFVVEQNCPYQDLDGLDLDAYHLLIKEENSTIATLRILKPGVVYKEVAIGRVASDAKKRHLKLGHKMMEESMNFIKDTLKENKVRLSAQTHLTDFYAKHGFKLTGKSYLEDGIPHSEMLY